MDNLQTTVMLPLEDVRDPGILQVLFLRHWPAAVGLETCSACN
jgi:hypothetical protein